MNFAPRPAPRGRDGKELIQCPTSSCDGMGHVSGNYATHRRQGSIDIDIDIDIDVQIIYIYQMRYLKYEHLNIFIIYNFT